jgi:topoisomerase IV subunit A
MLGEPEQLHVVASDAGYGFIVKLGDLHAKNRAGKTALSLPNSSKPLIPQLITNIETQFVAIVSNIGNLLIFPLKELPQLAKGKGNKMLSIPGSKVATREEFALDMTLLNKDQNLIIEGDGRSFTMKPADWKNYIGERARRGSKLPRGCRGVAKLRS